MKKLLLLIVLITSACQLRQADEARVVSYLRKLKVTTNTQEAVSYRTLIQSELSFADRSHFQASTLNKLNYYGL